jgi:hypothetical protein
LFDERGDDRLGVLERYRASEEFKGLAESTQSSYGVSLNRFKAVEAWGSAARP